MTPSLPRLTRTRAAQLFADESGAATAEYAIATMAAVAFAGLLVIGRRAQPTKVSGVVPGDGAGVTQPPRIPGKSSPAAGRSIHGMSSSHPHPPQR